MNRNPDPGCRILVVEDDSTIATNLVDFLQAHGHRVDAARDGQAAIARLGTESYDVVVLDLGLPRVDGMDVLRHMRGRMGLSTPVLIVTARDRIAEKISGFQSGADDYVTKPFSLAEVQVRVLALHRRASARVVERTLTAGRLRLDMRTREVFVDDRPVRLMPRSLQILECLLRDPGRVVPPSELEHAVWGDDPPDSDALRSQIHLLRRALSAAGFDGIETVPKLGFRLRCA